MLVVERHHTPGNPTLVRLCSASRELYNRANFLMRQAWFTPTTQPYKPLPDLQQLTLATKNLKSFQDFGNTKTAKQTLRQVITDWSNYRKALVAFKKNPSKFWRCPKAPGYKDKLTSVVFYRETLKGGRSAKKQPKTLTANNGCFSVPYREGYRQVVITPKRFGFMIDVQYERPDPVDKPKLDRKKVGTVDLGLNVLAAITLGQTRPILVNGRIVKSINQWYNKRPCQTRLRKRYFRLENYFHHVSKMIVDLCVREKVGKLVVGRTQGWKDGINLGKKTNQAFSSVPIESLLSKLQYKAAVVGIEVVFTEEAYTSQSSFYDRDPLPVYEKGAQKPTFSGRRTHRGLYVTQDGFAVHADVNGSLNIGRKVIPEFLGLGDRSLAARPVVVNPLKADRCRVGG